MVFGIWMLISPAGFFHDQTVLLPFKGDTVVYKESKRKEKWVELVLNCRTTLIQTHIKAFRYQTSLVQSSWEHFHFKLLKFNIFQGNFSSVSSLSLYIHTYIKDKREEALANQTCHFLFSEQKRSCLALLYSGSFQTPKFSLLCHLPPFHSLGTDTLPASLHHWPARLPSEGAQRELGLPKVPGTHFTTKAREKRQERRMQVHLGSLGQRSK